MVAFLTYLLKSSFCLTLLYGFYKLLCASTTRFSLNRWVLVGGMLTCLLLPFVSLELEHEPLVQSPFILMEEWKQPVDVVSASGMVEITQKEANYWGWLVLSIIDGSLSVGVCLHSFAVGCGVYSSVPLDKPAGI
ncbi:hypothetical protein [Phocaeicola plebeius]|uniref:hypothetical protein n=1 Tax=Phocaeicola plebeius TaxID=310297 RepID=UPI002942F61F|nr:hypothetical protein [Phocaeicola plebeius]